MTKYIVFVDLHDNKKKDLLSLLSKVSNEGARVYSIDETAIKAVDMPNSKISKSTNTNRKKNTSKAVGVKVDAAVTHPKKSNRQK